MLKEKLLLKFIANLFQFTAKMLWTGKTSIEGGSSDIHDEIKSGRPSVVTDEIIQKIDVNIRADRCLTIDELH
jgi:hypothetical protein